MADTDINTVKKVGKILIARPADARREISKTSLNFYTLDYRDWKDAIEISYTKYTIKETDMRVKTATFTSPNYIDLTAGLTVVRISSIYHENFAGIILDVEYDPENGLYNYQCQDFSRRLVIVQDTLLASNSWNVYDLLINLITLGDIQRLYKKTPKSFDAEARGYFKNELSGLRPLGEYDQSLYKGNKYNGNPFKQKSGKILRGKTIIENIRNLVYGSLGFFDVYFNERGAIQIVPLSKTDWETTGLHLTTGSALKQKYNFSTTNAIAYVKISGSGGELGKFSTSKELIGLDLSAFFGTVGTSISDPTQKTTTTSASKSTSNATKTNNKTSTGTTKDNPYGTKKKEIWITIDNIYSKSSDAKFMNDFAAELKKSGWTCHVGGVGPGYHYAHAPGYSWAGKVWNAVWFTIYGGACAGTLREQCTAKWYRKPLVDRGSRTVVGFLRPPSGDIRKGGTYYKHLGPAHDWQGNRAYANIDYPAKFMTDKGVPFMYAKDAKQMAQKFLQGGDNPEACTKNWKWY